MRKKVLLVSDVFYPYPGGVSEHVHQLAIHLRKLGWESYILTANHKGGVDFKDPPYVFRVGFPVKILFNGSIAPVTISLRINSYVKRLMNRMQFDVVHIHGQVAPVLPMVSLKYSTGYNFITFHAAHKKNFLYKLFKPYIRDYFNKLHGRIAVSEAAIKPILEIFPDIEYRIIPNGVDLQRFRPDLQPLPHLQGYRNILFVGRPEPRKGLKYAILAMPHILREIPDARLVVVGDGPLLGWYKNMVPDSIKDRVMFEGRVSSQVLPRYYRTADVFISPATGSESFGLVLLEAMATGTPVVAARNEGYSLVIRDGENGLLCNVEDEVDLARKVVRVLKDEDLRRRLVEGGLRTARAHGWDRIASQVARYYVDVMEREGKHEGRGIRTV
ncbi:MAG: glycosyltransferase family 4 protein [Thermotogae bacterium]|nr:glycosyltransferase family 4 protein [Thermotogota bacterium]